MKKKLLLSAMLLAGWGLSAIAQETQQFNSVADCWIRSNNLTWKQNGSWEKVEIRKEGNATDGYADFAALYGFEFSVPTGMKVQSATVRFVTERWKGGPINLYGFPNDFVENTTWGAEESYLNTTLASEPLLKFTPAAQRSAALGSDDINEDYRDISKWTNTLDVTSYVQSLPASATRVNFFLTSAEDNTNQNCLFTREAADIVNAKDATLTFAKEDLVPLLIVTFVEDADQNTDVILPQADTQIRLGNTTNNATATAIELKSTSGGERFYGLMRFDLPVEILNTEKYEVQSVTLRLVTTQNKGDRNMQIFDYDNNFAENTIYANESDYVDVALAREPIAEYSANGYGSFSMGDNKSGWTNSDYTDVEKWTNYIDLTNYIVEKTNSQESSINLLITKKNEHNDAMKIATKEAVDITNAATEIAGHDAFTFKAEDLWPQLTIVYNKKEVTEPEEPEKPEIFYGRNESAQSEGEDKGEYEIWVDSRNDEVCIYFKAPEGADAVYYKYTLEGSLSQDNLMGKPHRAVPAPDVEVEAELSNWEPGYHELILPNGTSGTLTVRYETDGQSSEPISYTYKAAYNDPTAVDEIEAAQAVAEYFTLQGVRVLNPERGQIYIKVVAGKASKIVF